MSLKNRMITYYVYETIHLWSFFIQKTLEDIHKFKNISTASMFEQLAQTNLARLIFRPLELSKLRILYGLYGSPENGHHADDFIRVTPSIKSNLKTQPSESKCL